jgi:hypothetical protein
VSAWGSIYTHGSKWPCTMHWGWWYSSPFIVWNSVLASCKNIPLGYWVLFNTASKRKNCLFWLADHRNWPTWWHLKSVCSTLVLHNNYIISGNVEVFKTIFSKTKFFPMKTENLLKSAKIHIYTYIQSCGIFK